jgi:hypothetical protein
VEERGGERILLGCPVRNSYSSSLYHLELTNYLMDLTKYDHLPYLITQVDPLVKMCTLNYRVLTDSMA